MPEAGVKLVLELRRETFEIGIPLNRPQTLFVSYYQVLEDVLELLGGVFELNQSLAKVGEAICDADGVVGDHGT